MVEHTPGLPGLSPGLDCGELSSDGGLLLLRAIEERIGLDIDDTSDAVHGQQQLRLFNALDDGYGFQPILVFDDAGRRETVRSRLPR